MNSIVRLALFLSAALIAAPSGYHVIKEIKIGGEGGWDYLTVDNAARRLYVSHATKVVVVDIDAGKVVGEIPDTAGVHGIALAPDLNRGFTSNGRSNDVSIFDLKTLAVLGRIKTGQNPDAIRYASNRIFTFNGRSKDSTVIDAKAGTVEATIPLGGKPEFSAADGKGKIYVNIEDTAEIVEIDASSLAVTKRYSLKPCEEPSGLAMDTASRRLFSVCANKLMIVSDPDSGKVLSTLPIGDGSDGAVFDAARGLVFSSNGDSTMTVVSSTASKWAVVENVGTARGARTIALDEKTHNLFLPSAEFGPAPAATAQNPRPRPAIVADTFKILVVGR